jgi:nitrite reductase/ring-hydroxylating ferredoxin subunit
MSEDTRHSVMVARVGELQPGQTKKFILRCGQREVEAFLVNYDGTLYAYVNRCRHVPMSMDWIENRFLTEDGKYILCATHGACYEPDTGECIDGPALGKSLIPVSLSTHGEEIHATCPEEEMPVDLSRPGAALK